MLPRTLIAQLRGRQSAAARGLQSFLPHSTEAREREVSQHSEGRGARERVVNYVSSDSSNYLFCVHVIRTLVITRFSQDKFTEFTPVSLIHVFRPTLLTFGGLQFRQQQRFVNCAAAEALPSDTLQGATVLKLYLR